MSRPMPPEVEVIRGELLRSLNTLDPDDDRLCIADHLDLYSTDEWVLGSNFEDGLPALVRRADETWAMGGHHHWRRPPVL